MTRPRVAAEPAHQGEHVPLEVGDFRRLGARVVDAVGRDEIVTSLDTRLQTILHFTSTLMLRPIEGDKLAIDALVEAGLTTPAIVALGQLIAFLSYQIRMTAGLQAMAALEQAA